MIKDRIDTVSYVIGVLLGVLMGLAVAWKLHDVAYLGVTMSQ